MTATPETLTLYPYRKDSCWVFDDARTGLKEEAFVLGATDMITRVVTSKAIPDAERGFALTFAAEPFDGHEVELRWLRPDPAGGNWYAGDVVGQPMEAWLCPALLLYFRTPPDRIFVHCEALPPGIEPIWSPPPGVSGGVASSRWSDLCRRVGMKMAPTRSPTSMRISHISSRKRSDTMLIPTRDDETVDEWIDRFRSEVPHDVV
jgi:hypothetical protein